jgi:hypothetical protein
VLWVSDLMIRCEVCGTLPTIVAWSAAQPRSWRMYDNWGRDNHTWQPCNPRGVKTFRTWKGKVVIQGVAAQKPLSYGATTAVHYPGRSPMTQCNPPERAYLLQSVSERLQVCTSIAYQSQASSITSVQQACNCMRKHTGCFESSVNRDSYI